MDYRKLKGKIKEVFDTQEAFAEAMDMSQTSVNLRLNDKVEWKTQDIVRACGLLSIPLTETHLYFFTQKL